MPASFSPPERFTSDKDTVPPVLRRAVSRRVAPSSPGATCGHVSDFLAIRCVATTLGCPRCIRQGQQQRVIAAVLILTTTMIDMCVGSTSRIPAIGTNGQAD